MRKLWNAIRTDAQQAARDKEKRRCRAALQGASRGRLVLL